ETFRGSTADDLSKRRNANTHEFTAGAFLSLLFAEIFVTDHIHRFAKRSGIVAAIILPAERGFVWELLRFDKVLHAELSRVHADFLCEHIRHALDSMDGFGNTERATIGDTTRRLARIRAVHFDERTLE